MSKEDLNNAIRNLQIADHMTYVTYPLLNDKKLLLKIFIEINKCVINCIKYSVYKKDNLKPPLKKFLERNTTLNHEQIKKVKEIIFLGKKYKESAIEFVRRDKVVIMSDDLSIEALDVVKIKNYLNTAKELMRITINS